MPAAPFQNAAIAPVVATINFRAARTARPANGLPNFGVLHWWKTGFH